MTSPKKLNNMPLVFRTPFSEANKAQTDAAHLLARKTVYPAMFKVDVSAIEYDDQKDIHDDERWGILDGKMAIDQVLKVKFDDLPSPMTFTFQERFREPQYQRFNDLTVTEWNTKTDQPGELYKMQANYFTYGYHNATDNELPTSFLQVVVVNAPDMMRMIGSGELPHKRDKNPRSQQTFVAVTLTALERAGLIVYHHNKPQIAVVRPSEALTDSQVLSSLKSRKDGTLANLIIALLVADNMGLLNLRDIQRAVSDAVIRAYSKRYQSAA